MTTRASTAIVYPETDGMPLPDGEYQAPLYRRIVGDLEDHFRDVQDANVNGNTFIYYVEGNPRRLVSPDCYVVFGLSETALHSLSLEGNNTYLLWEVGKAPDFVLEVASRSTGRADYTDKRTDYERFGVAEYWRFDPSGGEYHDAALAGDLLVEGVYQPIAIESLDDNRLRGYSDALGLYVCWEDGHLRFFDPGTENYLRSHDEEHAGRLAAQGRAAAAEARAAELESELRRLRGE